ncbi:MAG: PTS transporter subunit EIIC [Coprococcus sp.]
MTGMHHALTPIGLNAIATGGADTLIFVSQVCSNLAQSGASLAVAVRSKDSNMKQLASAAGVSALMGITEPALYGVTLKLKRPVVAAFHRNRNRWYRRRTSSGFSLHCTELYHGDPGVYRREGIKQSDLWNHYDRGIFWSCFCSYTYLRI